MTATLGIGAVADATGLAPSAIRYYEELGLVDPPDRVSGKRRFEPDAVNRISFIVRASEAGFTLEEIGVLLDDTDGAWREMVDHKLDDLRDRAGRLETMIRVLEDAQECGCEAIRGCPRVGEFNG